MAYIRWCLLAFLQCLIVTTFSLPDSDLSLTHIQDVGFKVLNVAEELQREALPLKMGQRFYKLLGLKESSWYEVKISYPASIPASFFLDLKKNLAELQIRTSRRLLNTEKLIFKFDSKKLSSGENEAFVLVTVEPAGIVAKPNVQKNKLVLFNIICEELFVGIPHRAWWVGLAALLCLLLAAAVPYFLPLHQLSRIQDMQSGNVSAMKDS
ncbi:hypothetical protein IEQ34_007314 [Dendrobium chrysotoxum]|uniref:Uncharacterized protein n=1 Tax=Dendrobium chrysotoxum TaxID=161865 RepID=A0AAV7HAC0_DENCH|nr:hypothetical protein IEQ34_007314 [Dendrobium chrysotoxum]